MPVHAEHGDGLMASYVTTKDHMTPGGEMLECKAKLVAIFVNNDG